MAKGELADRGHGEHLSQQVRPEQVGESLVDVEVGVTDPCLGQDPVPFRVAGQEDGRLRTGALGQLWEKEEEEAE